jgi:hypothetical protein
LSLTSSEARSLIHEKDFFLGCEDNDFFFGRATDPDSDVTKNHDTSLLVLSSVTVPSCVVAPVSQPYLFVDLFM